MSKNFGTRQLQLVNQLTIITRFHTGTNTGNDTNDWNKMQTQAPV